MQHGTACYRETPCWNPNPLPVLRIMTGTRRKGVPMNCNSPAKFGKLFPFSPESSIKIRFGVCREIRMEVRFPLRAS